MSRDAREVSELVRPQPQHVVQPRVRPFDLEGAVQLALLAKHTSR